MSSMPPYENNNPYSSSPEYPSSGYQQPASGYQPPSGYQQPASGYQYPAQGYQQQANVYATPMYAAPTYAVMPVNDPGSGQALAGMILGIAGLFLSFFGLVPLLGLIFSIIGMRSVTRKGMAIAGLVMSIIGLVFAIFFTLILIGAIAAASNPPPTP